MLISLVQNLIIISNLMILYSLDTACSLSSTLFIILISNHWTRIASNYAGCLANLLFKKKNNSTFLLEEPLSLFFCIVVIQIHIRVIKIPMIKLQAKLFQVCLIWKNIGLSAISNYPRDLLLHQWITWLLLLSKFLSKFTPVAAKVFMPFILAEYISSLNNTAERSCFFFSPGYLFLESWHFKSSVTILACSSVAF